MLVGTEVKAEWMPCRAACRVPHPVLVGKEVKAAAGTAVVGDRKMQGPVARHTHVQRAAAEGVPTLLDEEALFDGGAEDVVGSAVDSVVGAVVGAVVGSVADAAAAAAAAPAGAAGLAAREVEAQAAPWEALAPVEKALATV